MAMIVTLINGHSDTLRLCGTRITDFGTGGGSGSRTRDDAETGLPSSQTLVLGIEIGILINGLRGCRLIA
jgi:hypothetical protein